MTQTVWGEMGLLVLVVAIALTIMIITLGEPAARRAIAAFASDTALVLCGALPSVFGFMRDWPSDTERADAIQGVSAVPWVFWCQGCGEVVDDVWWLAGIQVRCEDCTARNHAQVLADTGHRPDITHIDADGIITTAVIDTPASDSGPLWVPTAFDAATDSCVTLTELLAADDGGRVRALLDRWRDDPDAAGVDMIMRFQDAEPVAIIDRQTGACVGDTRTNGTATEVFDGTDWVDARRPADDLDRLRRREAERRSGGWYGPNS